MIAPEGTRSPTGALIEGRPGGSYLAVKAGVPVVAVAVTGTEDHKVVGELKRLRKISITIRIGTPFKLPPVNPRQREAELQQRTEEIMCQIAALLPARYRGVYSDHSRLLELLATDAQVKGGMTMDENAAV